ncbi:hypothetical protein EW146_g10276 [Bondarzewia mesenterica]|uniref:Uncharacterized protein n=1 Tax=Bondarzewia mesenterica TaxID=1095465 RepID=A0A4S4KYR9_9AGAM|nr:hypothetical protein EW146_g10276 [Bondarzewia mesenterica]
MMGTSPFQRQTQIQMQLQPTHFGTQNAFSVGTGQHNPFEQMSAAQPQPQPQLQMQMQQPFNPSTVFAPQQTSFSPSPSPFSQQSQPTSFTPQPSAFSQPQQPFAPQSQVNPFYNSGQGMMAQPQVPFRATPSPFGGMQAGSPFQQQQMFPGQGTQSQPQAQAQSSNPFTGWMQQSAPAQGEYTGQAGQWGTM